MSHDREDFMHRTVTLRPEFDLRNCEGDLIPVSVMRTRTSSGHAQITLRVGNQQIEFSNEITAVAKDGTGVFGGNYEAAVRAIADLLERAADEPCTLPKVAE